MGLNRYTGLYNANAQETEQVDPSTQSPIQTLSNPRQDLAPELIEPLEIETQANFLINDICDSNPEGSVIPIDYEKVFLPGYYSDLIRLRQFVQQRNNERYQQNPFKLISYPEFDDYLMVGPAVDIGPDQLALYSLKQINEGDLIAVYGGKILCDKNSDKKVKKICDKHKGPGDYITRVPCDDKNSIAVDALDEGTIARFANDSSNCNATFVYKNGLIYLQATRTIHPAEEITLNYGKEYFVGKNRVIREPAYLSSLPLAERENDDQFVSKIKQEMQKITTLNNSNTGDPNIVVINPERKWKRKIITPQMTTATTTTTTTTVTTTAAASTSITKDDNAQDSLPEEQIETNIPVPTEKTQTKNASSKRKKIAKKNKTPAIEVESIQESTPQTGDDTSKEPPKEKGKIYILTHRINGVYDPNTVNVNNESFENIIKQINEELAKPIARGLSKQRKFIELNGEFYLVANPKFCDKRHVAARVSTLNAEVKADHIRFTYAKLEINNQVYDCLHLDAQDHKKWNRKLAITNGNEEKEQLEPETTTTTTTTVPQAGSSETTSTDKICKLTLAYSTLKIRDMRKKIELREQEFKAKSKLINKALEDSKIDPNEKPPQIKIEDREFINIGADEEVHIPDQNSNVKGLVQRFNASSLAKKFIFNKAEIILDGKKIECVRRTLIPKDTVVETTDANNNNQIEPQPTMMATESEIPNNQTELSDDKTSASAHKYFIKYSMGSLWFTYVYKGNQKQYEYLLAAINEGLKLKDTSVQEKKSNRKFIFYNNNYVHINGLANLTAAVQLTFKMNNYVKKGNGKDIKFYVAAIEIDGKIYYGVRTDPTSFANWQKFVENDSLLVMNPTTETTTSYQYCIKYKLEEKKEFKCKEVSASSKDEIEKLFNQLDAQLKLCPNTKLISGLRKFVLVRNHYYYVCEDESKFNHTLSQFKQKLGKKACLARAMIEINGQTFCCIRTNSKTHAKWINMLDKQKGSVSKKHKAEEEQMQDANKNEEENATQAESGMDKEEVAEPLEYTLASGTKKRRTALNEYSWFSKSSSEESIQPSMEPTHRQPPP